MSFDGCAKHQSPDCREDPCVYCILDDVKLAGSKGKRAKTLTEAKELLDRVYQLSKSRLIQREIFLKENS